MAKAKRQRKAVTRTTCKVCGQVYGRVRDGRHATTTGCIRALGEVVNELSRAQPQTPPPPPQATPTADTLTVVERTAIRALLMHRAYITNQLHAGNRFNAENAWHITAGALHRLVNRGPGT